MVQYIRFYAYSTESNLGGSNGDLWFVSNLVLSIGLDTAGWSLETSGPNP
jgi:hypothetical protein